MIRQTLVVAAVAALPLRAQQEVELSSARLRPAVELIGGGAGGNVVVVEAPGQVLLVDAREAAALPELRRLLGPRADEVRLIVNTHYHEDHIGGNAGFPGAVTLAHVTVPADAARDTVIDLIGWHREAIPEAAWPTRLVGRDTSFTFGGVRVDVLFLPAAHTSGDLAVWLPDADVLHAGDVFELGAYPFLDIWAGATMEGLIAAIDRLLPLTGPATAIVPGHGPPSDREGLLAYRAMLVAVRDGVREARAAGASLEEVLERDIGVEYDGRYGSARGRRRLVGLTYLSLDPRP